MRHWQLTAALQRVVIRETEAPVIGCVLHSWLQSAGLCNEAIKDKKVLLRFFFAFLFAENMLLV